MLTIHSAKFIENHSQGDAGSRWICLTIHSRGWSRLYFDDYILNKCTEAFICHKETLALSIQLHAQDLLASSPIIFDQEIESLRLQ